jgi:hypothetical protein
MVVEQRIQVLMKKLLLTLALAAATSVVTPPAVQASDELTALFQQGRSAYYKGDLETAKALLSQVIARNPRHFETCALLAQINASLAANAGSSLKKKYSSVIIPKLEFADVSLNEALQGLSALSNNATAGKTIPNFIVKSPGAGDSQITLALTSVPLTEAINYLAQLSGTRPQYEDHAVVFVASSQ